MKRSITLIVKSTRLCNLRCSYCHDWRAERDQTMSFPVLARMTSEVLSDPEHAHVNFIWHGGEPTLLGQAFYERALLLQSRFRRPDQTVSNMIQTNGTRITPDWARFFRRYDIGVGLSIDGPPAIHDRTRVYVNGRPSWRDVRTGLQVMTDHGVKVSVLMVVDREVLELGPQGVFDFFLSEGITHYGLLAAKPDNQPHAGRNTPTDHYVSPPEMMRFLIEIDRIRMNHGATDIEIREVDILRDRILGIDGHPCTLVGGCIGNFFLIEPSGDVAHCDLFLDDPAYTFGNITEMSFAEIRASAALRAVDAANAAAVDRLRSCEEFGVCSGWCPHERYLSVRHNTAHDDGCCGARPLIRHLRARLPEPRVATASATSVPVSIRRVPVVTTDQI